MKLNITDMSKPLVGTKYIVGVTQIMWQNSCRIWTLCDVFDPANWRVIDLETGDDVYVTPERIRLP